MPLDFLALPVAYGAAISAFFLAPLDFLALPVAYGAAVSASTLMCVVVLQGNLRRRQFSGVAGWSGAAASFRGLLFLYGTAVV